MRIKSWGVTDRGLTRSVNQDFILRNDQVHIYIVADGMGGHAGGDIASQLAVESVQKYFDDNFNHSKLIDPHDFISQSYQVATKQIFEENSKNFVLLEEDNTGSIYGSMGTTMVMAFYYNGHCYIGNVGDSRAYLFDKEVKELYQITEDHSLVYENMKQGLITEEEMKKSNQKNIITRNLGFKDTVNVDLFQREVKPKDKILLCSDGLCGYVDHKKIEEICSYDSGDKVISECIKESHKTGGLDNISVILLEFY